MSLRAVITAIGSTASASAPATPAAQPKSVRSRSNSSEHGERAGERLGQQQRGRREAQELRGRDLQPEVDRRLVDRQARARVEHAVEEVVPRQRHRAHGGVVVRVRAATSPASTRRSAPAASATTAAGTPTRTAAGSATRACGRRPATPGRRSGRRDAARSGAERPPAARRRLQRVRPRVAVAHRRADLRRARANARRITRGDAPLELARDARTVVHARLGDARAARLRPWRRARCSPSRHRRSGRRLCTSGRRISLKAQSTSRTGDVEAAAHEPVPRARRSRGGAAGPCAVIR